MQVTAIYDNGAIRFMQPVQFKHSKFEVVMNIPDEAIATKPTLGAIDTLLAQNPDDPWLQLMKGNLSNVMMTPEQEIPELSQKQLDRVESFSYREER